MTEARLPQQKQSWIASSRKGLAVVALVILATIGGAYTQAWPKTKVFARTASDGIAVRVYIDDVKKGEIDLSPGDYRKVGVWSVSAGSHLVAVDFGFWELDRDWYWYGTTDYAYYHPPDDEWNFAYEYEVDVLYTKNVYVSIQPVLE